MATPAPMARYCATEKGRATRKRCNDAFRERNRDARNAYMRNWWAENGHAKKEMLRGYRYKRRYGITIEEYEALLERQNGHCALCPNTPTDERYKRLNVDHDHASGRVRGLLCTSCNFALGRLGDDVDGITRALEYVSGEGSDDR